MNGVPLTNAQETSGGRKHEILLAHSLNSRGLSWYVSRFPGRLCTTEHLALLTRVGIVTTIETERMEDVWVIDRRRRCMCSFGFDKPKA